MSRDDEAEPAGALSPGTGGLTLEPPGADPEDAPEIGFAPDLDEEEGERALGGPGPAADPPPAGADAEARYPRAVALLRALAAGNRSDDDEPDPLAPARAFEGPPITRPTAEVRRPPPGEPATDGETVAPDPTGELVDMVLVGNDEGGPPGVHLMFKQQVLGGLYLFLERRPEGLFARFQVADASARRALEGQVDVLLGRLRDKGMRIAGHEVVVAGS